MNHTNARSRSRNAWEPGLLATAVICRLTTSCAAALGGLGCFDAGKILFDISWTGVGGRVAEPWGSGGGPFGAQPACNRSITSSGACVVFIRRLVGLSNYQSIGRPKPPDEVCLVDSSVSLSTWSWSRAVRSRLAAGVRVRMATADYVERSVEQSTSSLPFVASPHAKSSPGLSPSGPQSGLGPAKPVPAARLELAPGRRGEVRLLDGAGNLILRWPPRGSAPSPRGLTRPRVPRFQIRGVRGAATLRGPWTP